MDLIWIDQNGQIININNLASHQPEEGTQIDQSEKSKADQTVREFGFNMVASDKISLDRRIKDTRPAEY